MELYGRNIHRSFALRLVDYYNGMMLYEIGCGQEIKEYTGQKLKYVATNSNFNENLLFDIFATPLESYPECVWAPGFKEVSLALVSSMEYQMQIYKNQKDLQSDKLRPR